MNSDFWHWLLWLTGGLSALAFMRKRGEGWFGAEDIGNIYYYGLPVAGVILAVFALSRLMVPGR